MAWAEAYGQRHGYDTNKGKSITEFCSFVFPKLVFPKSAGLSTASLTLTLGVPVLNSLLATSLKGNLFGEPFFFFGSFFFLGEQREERTTVVDFKKR